MCLRSVVCMEFGFFMFEVTALKGFFGFEVCGICLGNVLLGVSSYCGLLLF